MNFKNYLFLLGLSLSMGAAQTALAKTVNLYDSPDKNAKVSNTIDLAAGVIRIYSPQNSSWVKVADPKNGNVGWIEAKELNQPGTQNVSYSHRVVRYGNGPYSFQEIVYGPRDQAISVKQRQAMVEQMRQRQLAIQQSIQRAMHEMAAFSAHPFWADDFGFPMIMPVVIVEPQNGQNPKPHPMPKHQLALKKAVDAQNKQQG